MRNRFRTSSGFDQSNRLRGNRVFDGNNRGTNFGTGSSGTSGFFGQGQQNRFEDHNRLSTSFNRFEQNRFSSGFNSLQEDHINNQRTRFDDFQLDNRVNNLNRNNQAGRFNSFGVPLDLRDGGGNRVSGDNRFAGRFPDDGRGTGILSSGADINSLRGGGTGGNRFTDSRFTGGSRDSSSAFGFGSTSSFNSGFSGSNADQSSGFGSGLDTRTPGLGQAGSGITDEYSKGK